MTEIKNSIIAGIVFGILFGIFLALRFEIYYALIAGPISGLTFGLAMYFFMTSKKVNRQTQIKNMDGIFYSGRANHFKNVEAVGGKLYLFKDKLQFKSHNFNVQNHEEIIELNQIKEVNFYNTLGIIPNVLVINKEDGTTEKFVVNNRRIWKEEIEKLKSNFWKN